MPVAVSVEISQSPMLSPCGCHNELDAIMPVAASPCGCRAVSPCGCRNSDATEPVALFA